MLKKILTIVALFIVGMVGGIFADQIFWPYFIERPLFYQYNLENPPIYVTEIKQITVEENTALSESVEKAQGSVVGLKAAAKDGIILEGSGLIVTSDGLIVTLAELLPANSKLTVFVDGKEYVPQVLKKDSKLNLALLKITESNLKTAGFADLNQLKLGERVFLLGTVFEKNQPLKVVNEGMVRFFDQNRVQTNIIEKNTLSGSVLFNIKGEVLGLNTLDSRGQISAIPISKIKEFIGL